MVSKSSNSSKRRPRYPWLYALPGGCLPAAVRCGDARFELVETFKHDFFAATGLYRGPDGLAVLKVGRRNEFLTIPVDWIGKFLARREVRLYRLAQGLPGIPKLIGPVGNYAFLHEYIPGHPLERHEPVSDVFFDQLRDLLAALHARHIAYVDLNKRQNILVGDDGRPYLIDFQISLYLPLGGWRGLPPLRWLLRRFQHADLYHYLKHKRRLRPDLLTEDERASVGNLSFWIRLHRRLTRPLTNLRRRILNRLSRSETTEVAGSSSK